MSNKQWDTVIATPKSFVLAISALMLICTAASVITFSDGADAATAATLDVRDLDGDSISGTGYILEGAELDFTVESSPGVPDNFAVHADSVLVRGSLYLYLDGSSAFGLTGHMFTENPWVGDFGLRLSLYTEKNCSGTPVASAEFFDDTVMILSEELQPRTPYYIKVETVQAADFPEAPNISAIGFGFTASMPDAGNIVRYYSDGELVGSELVENGGHYTLPSIKKEGYTLIGWYDSPELGMLYRSTDMVDLTGDIDLYAYWWEGGSRDVHYETLDGCSIDISVKVGDKVTITVNAASPDGSVTAATEESDVSQLYIDLPFTVKTLDAQAAEYCASISSAVSSWFTIGRMIPYVQTDGERTFTADAAGIMSENGISLRSTAGDAYAAMGPAALGSVYRQCTAMGLSDAPLTLTVRELSADELTDGQKDAAGNRPVWRVSLKAGDTYIERLSEGSVEVRIPAETGGQDVRIYMLAHDGSRTEFDCTAEDGSVTFSTSVFSDYMTSSQPKDGERNLQIPMAIILVAISIAILGGILRARHH